MRLIIHVCLQTLLHQASTFQVNDEDVIIVEDDFHKTEKLLMIGENELNESEAELLERERRSFYRSGASLGQETSATLDYLLFESGYNRRVRPSNGGGEPVVVNVNMANFAIQHFSNYAIMVMVFNICCIFFYFEP